MISFLKTLAIILLVYFALRFLIKLAAPYLLRFVTKKAEKKMKEMFNGFEKGTHTAKKDATVPKKSSKVVGEYIDYEEVSDT